MTKGIRYSDEFKRDAVLQVVDRGYSVQEVADRLGITTKSLYGWKAKFGRPKAESDKDAELRRLKSELARVTPSFFGVARHPKKGNRVLRQG